MSNHIRLVHPLYLDVPMMTSFLAALEDGVAYGFDITRQNNKQKAAGAEGEGRAGIPNIPILSSLLNFDLRGKISENNTIGSSEEIKLIRKHTEASLFIHLRHLLQESGSVKTITSAEDISRIEVSDLIEVTGQLFRNPLTEALEAIMRTLGLFGIEVEREGVPLDHKAQQLRRNKSSNSQRQVNPLIVQSGKLMQDIEQFTENAEVMFILKILERMRQDLLQSKIVDVVMSPLTDSNFEAVVALSTDYLSDGAFQTLMSGEFTILGKVVRVLQEEEVINLYQRTTFTYLSNTIIDPIFEGFRKQAFLNIPENSSYVEAPAIQIIPLGIFT